MEDEIKNKLDYINAGINFSNTVRTTLGPKGMNKMVIKENESILTNDGATIISNINFNNPVGEILKNLAKSQEKAVGDGTTTAILLAGQFLENARDLLNKKVHPTTIINGFQLAKQFTIRYILENNYPNDIEKVIKTVFGSKISQKESDMLTNLLRDIEIERLRIAKLENESPENSRIIKGFVFSGYTMNDRMPKNAEGRIAVLDLRANIEMTKIQVNSADELEKVERKQKEFKREIVRKLSANNVSCVFLSDTNEMIENFLSEANIMSIVVYKRDMLDNLCSAIGAKAIGDQESDFNKYLGFGRVTYDKERQLIYAESKNSQIDTLLLCGSTKQTIEETERAVDDVVGVLKHTDKCVTGAGALEIELGEYLRKEAKSFDGKEQIVIEKFAESVEAIPLILAENCGLDAMEVLSLLKSQHAKGKKDFGVDPVKIISDAKERGIIEPISLKLHAISGATDVANLILKLDDIYTGRKEK